ncbi:cytochrome c oxidase assembly protein [Glaciecola sp. MF2-115]|uniref:cytochrome c oxidase assembly protein n=1 Tax=Glaciecola sp. MF2-115 TaxID=3384827 RepID=UPI0039A02841
MSEQSNSTNTSDAASEGEQASPVPAAKTRAEIAAENAKTVKKLVFVVVAMLGFSFALVPLYDVFCDLTGINGKPSNQAAVYESVVIDESRTIKIEFITRTHSGMPWEFKAQTAEVRLHPGEMGEVEFYVRNPTERDIIAQAIPSISPGTAALYVNKTECFCFKHQPLKAGEEAIMPMKFYVDPQLPKDISVFTLQYTLYDITANVQPAVVVAMNNS